MRVTVLFAVLLVGCGASTSSAPPKTAEGPKSEEPPVSEAKSAGRKEVFRSADGVVYAVEGKADTYVVEASNEKSGVKLEYDFLATQHCGDGSGAWKTDGQALLQKDGHPWDALDVTCTTTGEKKTVMFDIGAFFGKF